VESLDALVKMLEAYVTLGRHVVRESESYDKGQLALALESALDTVDDYIKLCLAIRERLS
jgi:hypothetical protein